MKLPSFKFEMTPERRFGIAFWTGWAFHMSADALAKGLIDSNWAIFGVGAFFMIVLLVIYTRNAVNFGREFTWMMLKTGGPEKDDSPSWPPPPPKPRMPLNPTVAPKPPRRR